MIKMKSSTRFRIIWIVIWALSFFALITGLVFIRGSGISNFQKNVASLFIQIGGAFFFALSVGWIVEKLRNAQGYSVLWEFSQEFQKAGILAFYSDRKGHAEKVLEEAFEKHRKGDVLIAGASLRFFLASSGHLYPWIQKMLQNEDNLVNIRALFCSPENNHELPIRSFVEEFNQDATFSRHSDFDWKGKITFSIKEFESKFFDEHGINAPQEQKLRVIEDLGSTRIGVRALKGTATHTPNFISHREIRFAPYCTTVIFPDRAFYTPNLLCTEVPVNMPMIIFHKNSHAYEKLLQYFEFLWWVSDPDPGLRSEDV